MDMKLNGERVKTLRLSRSWSQEKLAEAAGVNPRTIQRVESDGTGSLQTRLRLARALEVEPEQLDGAQPTAPETGPVNETGPEDGHLDGFRRYLGGMNRYHFPLLLLISCIYLAWTPIYFSLSRSTFSWINSYWNAPIYAMWLGFTLTLWLVLAVPWLTFIRRTRRAHFGWHLTSVSIPLVLGIVRLWLPELVMSLLTWSLFLSGLALLASCHLPRLEKSRIQQLVYACLFAYVFLWFFQSLANTLTFISANLYFDGGGLPAGFWSGLGAHLMRLLRNSSQLFPIALVLLYSLGTRNGGRGNPARTGDAASRESSEHPTPYHIRLQVAV